MTGKAVTRRRTTLLETLMRQRRLTREHTVDLLDRRARQMGVSEFALSVRQLYRWLSGEVETAPRPSVCRVVEAEFGYPIQQLLAETDGPTGPPAETRDDSGVGPLRTLEFVEWLADHSSKDLHDVYLEVTRRASQAETRSFSLRAARNYQRARISRAQLAGALAAYYSTASRLYRAAVNDVPLTLSVLSRPEWHGLSIPLGSDREHAIVADLDRVNPRLDHVGSRAAIDRLAQSEVSDTVMVNEDLYCLLAIDIRPDSYAADFGVADFAAYALTADLLEDELLDALVANDSQFPLRERYLPDLDHALRFEGRICAGGPACLVAIARGTGDYALLVQERSAQVVNVAGRLAVVPKAFHQPIVDVQGEAGIGATVAREIEEELLGRLDLDQVDQSAARRAAPDHDLRLSPAMRWLRSHPGSYRCECTAFGINMVTGNYEFACLILIDDSRWWDQYAHLVEGNWEVLRLRCVSSQDTGGLCRLISDPRWSNEGLFAFLEGLRRLAEIDPSRCRIPHIEVAT